MEPAKAQEHEIEECPREEQLERLNLQARNIEYNDYMELVKSLDITNFAPPEWLKHTETPFKWSQCLKPEFLFKADLDSKLDDYSYNNSCYILEKCSLLLTLVFEKVLLKNNAKARTYLKQLKEVLSNISCDESNEMFIRVGPALNHIYSATNAYLMSTTTDLQLEETSKNIGASLEPVAKMSPQIQAGVEALKGKFYLWCYTDSNYPLEHMLKASVLDPDFAPWQYWIGKILRKIRREMKEKEPKEEILYLESAVEKQRDTKHLIYLAQAYREKANFLHKANSSDFGFFKSDISREIDTLNQKSLDLYSKTQKVQSQKLTGSTVYQIKERTFDSEIDLVVCSETKDLILTANSRGEVSLHRSLDLQSAWTRSPPDCEVNHVRQLIWRPDEQAIAIAYSFNKVGCHNEDSVLKALVLVVSIENEELNSINVAGDVTSLNWCESKVTSSFPTCFTNYFPEPTPLCSTFCLGVDLKKNKNMLKENSGKSLNFLSIGSSVGDLKVMVSGFLSCCSLNINRLLGHENKKYYIRNTVFSSDLKIMFVFIEEVTDSVSLAEREFQLLVLDTSVLTLEFAKINLLQTRIGQTLTLIDRITEVQSCLTEVWECLKVAEIASNFNKYVEHFDSIDSMVADFCELITFGVLSSSLEQFLLQSLSCYSVKKIAKSVIESCSNVGNLVPSHLIPRLEELLLILNEMTGMAQLKEFQELGLATSFLSIASNNVRTLVLKAVEFLMVVQSLGSSSSAFYQWLVLVITKLNSDETHERAFTEGLTENDLSVITNYLRSIGQISYSYDEPISFFQHLSQYFDDICLSKPVEPHKWQEFLANRHDFVKVACIIPTCKTLSLAQCFKNVHQSISTICSAPEKAISSLYSVKCVVDLPERLMECSVVNSCYFPSNLTLLTVFFNINNTGEFGLLEVLPYKENYIKRQKVLRLDGNGYKCLDVKWYPNEKMFALFQEGEYGNPFLVQIEKSVIGMSNSDIVNINEKQENVFVWRIPSFPVFCFVVSSQREFGVAVCKNKKNIITFGFDEDCIRED